MPVQLGTYGVERLGEHRERLVQSTAHPGPLRTLPGEEEAEPAVLRGGALCLSLGRSAGDERTQAAEQVLAGLSDDDGPVVEGRAAGGEREGQVQRGRLGALRMGQHVGRLAQQCLLGLPGDRPDERGRLAALLGPRGRLGTGGRLGDRGLFDDRVRVRAAHTERGDAESLRPARLRPVPLLGQQLDGTRRPVDVRGGLVDVQGLRQRAVAHRLDHLDDAGDAGGCLGVAEVGLDRAEQHRPVGLPVPAIGGEQCLRLDRVAECRTRAVGLDRVDLVGGEAGVRQRLLDDALLGRPVGGGEAVARTVLVHGGTADDGQDFVSVAARVRQLLQQQQAGTLGPPGAVGGLGEGLAAAVGGQPALRTELDEGTGGRHDRHAAGQSERALPLPQSVRGQVQGDERRRTRGVHGDSGALETERVGHASRDDAGRRARQAVPLDALR